MSSHCDPEHSQHDHAPSTLSLRRISRRMLLAMGSFGATTFLGRRYVAIAQDHPLYNNEVKIYIQGDSRYIVSNGIPNHKTGSFPNPGNPNRISPQQYQFQMPAKPVIASQVTWLGLGPFGVAVNGVPLEPGAAEFWNGDRNWQYEALSGKINLGFDSNNAHVQPTGAYHYHGLPLGLIAKFGAGARMLLIGYAADGFPIYAQYGYANLKDPNSQVRKMRPSYRVKQGLRSGGPGGQYDGTFVQDYEYVVGSGDLDECNGRFGVTPEYPQGIYHYYVTETFPFISRGFRGMPDSRFRKRPSSGQPGQGQLGPPPGPPGSRPPRPPGSRPPGPPPPGMGFPPPWGR